MTFAALKNRIATFKQRFDAFDDRLDAWADRHWPVLNAIGITLSFAMLFGAVALHAYQTGLGPCRRAVRRGAILYVKLYAGLDSTVQRRLFDPLKYVRPEPPAKNVARWAAVLHVLLGFAVFLAIASLAKVQIPGRFFETTLQTPHGFKVSIGDAGSLEMVLGWWVGGLAVLRFFWPTYPRGGRYTRDQVRP